MKPNPELGRLLRGGYDDRPPRRPRWPAVALAVLLGVLLWLARCRETAPPAQLPGVQTQEETKQ